MNEPLVIWGEGGFASSSGWATVFATNPSTGEYLSQQQVWVSVGTGLPAGAYLDEPVQAAPGKAIVRSQTGWESVDDYRGQTAYDKRTRQSVVIKELGELPRALTLTPPSSPFDVWDADLLRWVKDQEQEDAVQAQQAQQQRQALMSEASQEIAVLTDALDPDVISEPSADDQVKLIAWKAYRVALSKVDQQAGYPHTITWPPRPGDPATE
ncbi:tail fiber assembly protein [Aeromonas salmonicida]|uniref:tail fiber assembly protein n=1 Tax=Aeromonas salmonicida TaxID=645 RepID=UPI00192D79EC|nr:tail fiber assembly protein [Aeromonas salmonicida]